MAERARQVMALLLTLLLCGCAAPGTAETTSGRSMEASSAAASAEKSVSVPEQASESTSQAAAGEEFSAEDAFDSSAPAEASMSSSAVAQEETQPRAVLVFGSDFQSEEGWPDPADTVNGLLDAVYADGWEPDNYIFCGDYSNEPGHYNYDIDPGPGVQKLRELVKAHDETVSQENLIFVQGNHDAMTDALSAPGLHEFPDYLVYVLNAQSEFPWKQGKEGLNKTVRRGAKRLDQCLSELAERGEQRPIFLAAHVPLHFSGRTSPLHTTGDNLYARKLFRVIDRWAPKLNLVYLYGHNHSKGWDSYLGGSCVFRAPGDTLLVPVEEGGSVTSSYEEETLQFTYLNAGFLGYFSGGGGESSLTCTVCEIWEDHLSFTRYDEEGVHRLSAAGTANPWADDRELIPEACYGTELASPQRVNLHE